MQKESVTRSYKYSHEVKSLGLLHYINSMLKLALWLRYLFYFSKSHKRKQKENSMHTSTPPRQQRQKVMVLGIEAMIYCTLGLLLYLSTWDSYKLKRCYALYVQYEIFRRKGLRVIKCWKCTGKSSERKQLWINYLKETHQFESTSNLDCIKITYYNCIK